LEPLKGALFFGGPPGGKNTAEPLLKAPKVNPKTYPGKTPGKRENTNPEG